MIAMEEAQATPDAADAQATLAAEVITLPPQDWPVLPVQRGFKKWDSNPIPGITWRTQRTGSIFAHLNAAARHAIDAVFTPDEGQLLGCMIRLGVGADEGKFALEPCHYVRAENARLTLSASKNSYYMALTCLRGKVPEFGSSELHPDGNLFVVSATGWETVNKFGRKDLAATRPARAAVKAAERKVSG